MKSCGPVVLFALLVLAASATFAASAGLTADADHAKRALLNDASVASIEIFSPTVPTWFRNAKFGIFMHFGIHTATEYDAWYGRRMYEQVPFPEEQWCDPPHVACIYNHHVATHGHPSVFGFKDFVPLWTAEHWDPDALVAFYKSIGAKYVVPVAMYHDNFDNFNSSHQRWNSVNMGPKRDIVGGWRAACDKHGLRLGVSDHASRAWQWLATAHGSDAAGPLAGVPYDGALTAADGKGKWWEGYNPQELYLAPRPPNTTFNDTPDSAMKLWYDRATELVEVYKPDLLYFDWGTIPNEPYGSMLTSEFIKASAKRNGGTSQAVVTYKHAPMADNFVQDVEKGRFVALNRDVWQTDTTLNNDWFYIKDKGLKMTGPQTIRFLIDVVSKNGNLLLNVGLFPNGTLQDLQRNALMEVGRWLSTNGEAIYDTRPWVKFGEGPSNDDQPAKCQEHMVCTNGTTLKPVGPIPITNDLGNFTNQDIRFTVKGDSLFAIVMDRPDKTTLITSLPVGEEPQVVKSVKMLGHAEPLTFSRDATGMTVVWPTPLVGDVAWVLEISTPAG